MNNNRNVILYVIVGLIVICLLVIFFTNNEKKHIWSESYRLDDKEPYGLFVTPELLKEYFVGKSFEVVKEPMKTVLIRNEGKSNLNYVFIGEDIFLDSASLISMKVFLESGNNVFIASKFAPTTLLSELYPYECEEGPTYFYDTNSVASMNFIHTDFKSLKDFKYTFMVKNKPKEYFWHYMDSTMFCNEDQVPFVYLGTINDGKTNFIKIKYGKGNLFLHSNPIVFTNYFMIKPEGAHYASKVFSHLPEGNILWDEYSKIPSKKSEYKKSPGPLNYILSQPALRWAWYMILGLALLYLIFHAKRKQKVIPVLEVNSNTSIEFTETLGRIYYMQNNHRKLGRQKKKLFLSFIRNRYQFSTTHLTDELTNKIINKSKVSPEVVEKIFNYFSQLEDKHFSADDLIDMHQTIDHFYKNCK